MIETLWFVMPVFERVELTKLCLNRLRWTCDQLSEPGAIDQQLLATAVVVGDEPELLDHASQLGFWTVEQDNMPLGRKWNDGYELAGREGADYFCPVGSDNWLHPAMMGWLPERNEVCARRHSTIVREDGSRMCQLNVKYDGGDGIRTFPRHLFEHSRFRPCREHARRAVDTSVVERLRRDIGWRGPYVYHDVHPLQVIGWQSHDVQLNKYADLVTGFGMHETTDVWQPIADMYGEAPVNEMRELYLGRRTP